MERLSLNEKEIRTEQLRERVRQIADMYISAAGLYLDDGDPLRRRIINFYSMRPETEQELLNVLSKKNEEEITSYIQSVRNFTGSETKFIEQTEKFYELQDVHKRRKENTFFERPATDEEYKLGAYVDVLEFQVRDAVLAAQKKGYLTFQSGFREKSDRDQFMDFYNRNITITEDVIKFLEEKSIKIIVEKLDDRTTLTLHPIKDNLIRIAEWKKIWDILIAGLPTADLETIPNMKSYEEHTNFRNRQDSLRKQKN